MISSQKKRSSCFSYQCQCCNRCCHNKLIQVNPFELLHIAKCIGLSTTEVLAQYVQSDSPHLKQKSDGSCVFLGDNGCQIHAHRPGVCRIYPLGRFKDDNGQEYFIDLNPAPGSEGVYGENATIAEYIEHQGVDPYFDAGEKCLKLQYLIVEKLTSDTPVSIPEGFGESLLEWIDVDKILSLAGQASSDADIENKLNRCLVVLDQWLSKSNK